MNNPQFTSPFSAPFFVLLSTHLAHSLKHWLRAGPPPGVGLHGHHSSRPKTLSESLTTSPQHLLLPLWLPEQKLLHTFFPSPDRQTPPCPLRISWNLNLSLQKLLLESVLSWVRVVVPFSSLGSQGQHRTQYTVDTYQLFAGWLSADHSGGGGSQVTTRHCLMGACGISRRL